MKLPRRQFLHLAAGAAALPVTSQLGWAQDYPTRPVRIFVGYAAAGGNDIMARIMGQWLSEKLGQRFIIENRPGAGTNLATEAALRAPPDGYTLLLASPASAINATLYENLSFNFIRDSTPVGGITSVPDLMVVHPSVPAKTVAEFVAYAKANPGKLNMASAGNGSTGHVCGELFKMMTGVNLVHVPYRGNGPALTDILAGQVQVLFPSAPSAIEYVRAGTLRALAVTTAKRSPAFPDTPALDETVPGYEALQWYGLVAPRNTPAQVVGKLNAVINAGLADPTMKARLADLGGVPMAVTPGEFGKFIADETEKWGKVVKYSGAKPE
jgi:tripartite-type tricarboxylate transporter receptor subunit TctC